MPVATLHLISLKNPSTLTELCTAILRTPSHQPIILSKPIRWMIVPEHIDTKALLSPSEPWDLLYIHSGTQQLPEDITRHIQNHYTLQTGVPSRLLKNFTTTNAALLHPDKSSIPPLTSNTVTTARLTKSSQDLTLSTDLYKWIQRFSRTKPGQNAVSMLNLLAFKPSQAMKESYQSYGREFARSIGSKRGGNAKLVGHVLSSSSSDGGSGNNSSNSNNNEEKWDEFALAHYPSILHFAEMLASQDYQDVNQKYRVPALKDTCILCTSEVVVEDSVGSLSSSIGPNETRMSKL